MTSIDNGRTTLEILDEDITNGARTFRLVLQIGVGLPRCSAGTGSLLERLLELTVARADTATSLTRSARKNVKSSY